METALSEATITASLTQEVVRRLVYCSLDTPKCTLQEIMSGLAQKMLNSGHTRWYTKVILIQGVTKFLHRVRLSRLQTTDSRYRPLHLPKEHREAERQLNKCLAKTTWHKSKTDTRTDKHQSWRADLKGAWRGSKPIQRPVKGIPYSTVFQVPNTSGSLLLKAIAKV